MAALGFGLLPFNMAATTYVVYAAALAPLALTPAPLVRGVLILAAGIAVEMAFIAGSSRLIVADGPSSSSSWSASAICSSATASARTPSSGGRSEDVEEMAKVAERERIARDLHDLLGHTLSVIALKSELASKLADRDPARAVAEIREVERVSRDALAEVRAAVEGYKGRGFSGELRSAEQALGSAGVRLDTDVKPVTCSPRQEAVLALALRETVTNVVRHARASVCRVALGVDDGRSGHDDSGRRHRRTAAGRKRVRRHARAGDRRRRDARHRSDGGVRGRA